MIRHKSDITQSLYFMNSPKYDKESLNCFQIEVDLRTF